MRSINSKHSSPQVSSWIISSSLAFICALTAVLKANAYAATVIPEAQASAMEIVESARSYSNRISTVAKAESERFKFQLAAYKSLPAMFKLNSKLDVLEKETAAIRKYIVGSDLKDEIYEMNFETRERLDLVDIDAADLSNAPANWWSKTE